MDTCIYLEIRTHMCSEPFDMYVKLTRIRRPSRYFFFAQSISHSFSIVGEKMEKQVPFLMSMRKEMK